MNDVNNRYDAIVIGSGMGGLTCASLLAQMDKSRVLVLERHFTAGGYTHMFKRQGKYQWDVGVHYVGEMAKGSLYRTLFDYVSQGKVAWQQMPSVFDRFIYPDLTFDARIGFDVMIDDLITEFPQEEKAIRRYRRDLVKAARWFGRFMLLKFAPDSMQPIAKLILHYGAKKALKTTKNYLDSRFQDTRLKAVIASQWGDIGIPPGSSAFAAHALIVIHYCSGGYYPVGGAKVIADSIIPILEKNGGQLLTRHRVDQILVDNNKAVGVQVITREKGKETIERYYADTIVSNAGAYITFNQLIPENMAIPMAAELKRLPPGSAHVCLYIGFKDNPKKLGFNGENLWIYNGYDHDKIYANRKRVVNGEISACFLSFPSLKDPAAKGHTAELISFADYDQFEQWSVRPWKKRGEEYDAIKNRISRALIDFVEKRYPGFRDLIEFHELSTPITTAEFTGHHQGCIYGLPAVPEKFCLNWLKPKTPIQNLYLTGSDVAGHGIVGAFMGGIMTTLAISKKRMTLIKLILLAKLRPDRVDSILKY